MKYANAFFDPNQRKLEKEESRRRDEARLVRGEVSRDDLRRENGLFSSLKIVNAKILDRHYRVKA